MSDYANHPCKFRKKPIVIEALRWPGSVPPLDRRTFIEFAAPRTLNFHGDMLRVPTDEGVMEAAPGDWIIKGIQGELYPCKPDIFEKTYEPAD